MLWVRGVHGSEHLSLVGSYCLLSCHHDDVMTIAILIPYMYHLMFENRLPVLVIGITCTVTLSTINTNSRGNVGYDTRVKYLHRTLPISACVLLTGNCILHMGKRLGEGVHIIYGVRVVCGVVRYILELNFERIHLNLSSTSAES